MRYPSRKVLRRALRPLERRFFPGAIVLGYHRVSDDAWDPLGLQVKPPHFTAQLAVLKRLRTVISLRELTERKAAGETLDQYAVVTFDDGYSDFADTVTPIAGKAGVPVTVFVASGPTGHQFWWEEMTVLLTPGSQGTPSLDLRLDASETLRFGQLDQPRARAAAVDAIGSRLACADRETVDAVLEQLRSWAGPDFGPSPAGVPMDAAALRELARAPHVEIGGHTVSHCCLERLGLEEQRREIAQNKADLENMCGVPVHVFSYPNGSLSGRTPGLVQAVGYSGACASGDGVVSARTDPFRIPRLWVPDIAGPDFRRWLGKWVAEGSA
ncbi:polysaccharide deacetylase family protein [Thioalkalivibrio sp.]|uniref:polysaccharide deacetylase family protein n=1 Tax=Thioalkalivibrio sp. TaxID=2093813 RepID=UPI00356AA1B8